MKKIKNNHFHFRVTGGSLLIHVVTYKDIGGLKIVLTHANKIWDEMVLECIGADQSAVGLSA